MLSPSRLKNGWSSTRMVMYRSPGGPPATPALPLPATRSRDPEVTPAGCGLPPYPAAQIRPSPRQVGQAFFSRPVPPQRWHVRLNFIAPAIWVTVPVPSHSGQTATLLPAEGRSRDRSRTSPAARYSAYLGALDRLPEIDVQPILQIRAAFRLSRRLVAAPAEELAENVAETPTAFACPAGRAPLPAAAAVAGEYTR